MEFTNNLTHDVETVMGETDIMMPTQFVDRTTSTHSNNELMAGEIDKENEPGNFDPSGDVELVDAAGRSAGRKRKRAPPRSRSHSTKKRRTGVASRTRSRSKRGNSGAAEHADYVCSVCGVKQNSKKTMRSKRAK